MPKPPPEVKAAFDAMPAGTRGSALALRDLIFRTAKENDLPVPEEQTTLVSGWRERFGDQLRFESNRAMLVDVEHTPLTQLCILEALTYHAGRKSVSR